MNKPYEMANIKVSDLILDKNNPRFKELYQSDKEKDLIEYLLNNEAGIEIAKAISLEKDFHSDEALWVMENENHKYVVYDGNRRCAAVKALQNPSLYGLSGIASFNIEQLPVLIYFDKMALEKRIATHHTTSLFREWGRLAKALEAKRLRDEHNEDLLSQIDSKPADLLKLANFYYEAVKIAGDDLKNLMRGGRGKDEGKATVFERLFKFNYKCGFHFAGKPSYDIIIDEPQKFNVYILAMVQLLQKSSKKITHKIVDDEKENFFNRLKPYGFDANKSYDNEENDKDIPSSGDGDIKDSERASTNQHSASDDSRKAPSSEEENEKGDDKTKKKKGEKGNIKQTVNIKRANVPGGLIYLLNECKDLKVERFPNSKMAMCRVLFECTLKYVMEATIFNDKPLKDWSYFTRAYYKTGTKEPLSMVRMDELKKLFENLIREKGKKACFQLFDLDIMHQVIHNKDYQARSIDAAATYNNLIPILEFMLEDEQRLIESLDLSKLGKR